MTRSGLKYRCLCRLSYSTIVPEMIFFVMRTVASFGTPACLYFRHRLLLPSNHLRAAGGKAIASMLLSNAALLCLDVSDNQLGSPGIEAIATAIVKNT